MATIIDPNDLFSEWRTKFNDSLGEIGDLTSLSTTANTEIVGAINEVNSNVGTLSSLTTTDQTSAVGAINELDGDVGDTSTLTTTATTDVVAAVNELDGEIGDVSTLTTTATDVAAAINEVAPYINGATFVVGAEAGNVVNVAIQLKASDGTTNLASVGVFDFYLASDTLGENPAAPADSIVIGTNGKLLEIVADTAYKLISNTSGQVDIDITYAGGAYTYYIVVILPRGELVVSTAATFT